MPTPSEILSTKLYAKIEQKFGKLPKPARAAFKKFTDAVAEGIVDYLGTDAQMTVSVETTIVINQGGLQTAAGLPTGAPPAPITLKGTGTGRVVTQTQ